MDGSISLPAELDQLDEFKALFEHLSSILPLQVREQFASDKNRLKQIQPASGKLKFRLLKKPYKPSHH